MEKYKEIINYKKQENDDKRIYIEQENIKRDIDTAGWWDYAKEYTNIVLAIVLFAALKYIVIPNYILDLIWDVLLNLFMFVTQFLGIGIIYSVIKEKKSNSDIKK